jgi:hypothetical protein
MSAGAQASLDAGSARASHRRNSRVPAGIVFAVLAFAGIAGGALQHRYPAGFLFYTPQDWCAAIRTPAFAVGYLAVLALAAAVALAAFAVGFATRRSAVASTALGCLLAWGLAAALLPAIESALPRVPDTGCTGHAPAKG